MFFEYALNEPVKIKDLLTKGQYLRILNLRQIHHNPLISSTFVQGKIYKNSTPPAENVFKERRKWFLVSRSWFLGRTTVSGFLFQVSGW